MRMKSSVKQKPCLWDALVAAAVLLLALGTFLVFYGGRSGGEALTAVITVDGAEYSSYPLSAVEGEQTVTPEGLPYPMTITLSSRGAQVTYSACPTQDCVHTGEITRSGESIVCLPNRVSVRLVGGKSGIDAAIG